MTVPVNYIKLINWFWDTAPFIPGFKSSHAALFLAIVDSINRNKWNRTSIGYECIVNKCKLGNKVYFKDRQWLIDNGLIEVTAGKNSFQMALFSLGAVMLNDMTKDTGNDTTDDTSSTWVPTHNNKHINSEIVKPKHCLSTDINIPFSEFWDLYDKKVGDKTKLEKKWNSLKDEERQKAVDHIPKYQAAQPDKKFRKDPQTYLNNKSFNDEIINQHANSNNNSGKTIIAAGNFANRTNKRDAGRVTVLNNLAAELGMGQ